MKANGRQLESVSSGHLRRHKRERGARAADSSWASEAKAMVR